MKSNSIFEIFKEGFEPGCYKRVQSNSALNLYVGKNENGLYSFEYRGVFTPTRVKCSELILVEQFSYDGFYSICFSLNNAELLERFSIFCQDLVDAVENIDDDCLGYKEICNRFFSWKKLFKPNTGNLAEPEIMGLIGELLFLRDEMIPLYGEDKAIESWMGPERTHKDFSFDNKWVEIKTISSGKESVRISSVEQLDGNDDGCLAVYSLEKMSTNYNGIKLNALVNGIYLNLHNAYLRDLYMSKLSQYGYDGAPDYDNVVFDLTNLSSYVVKDDFPRLKREVLPMAITKAQYDITLSDLESYKEIDPWK